MRNPRGSRDRSDTPQTLYALVKWCSGAHVGTYTHNVRVDWIKDFDPSNYDTFDESYVIEWQQPPKPQKGWPLFDGQVLEVSADLEMLKRIMKEKSDAANPIEEIPRTPSSSSATMMDVSSAEFKALVAAAVAAASGSNVKATTPGSNHNGAQTLTVPTTPTTPKVDEPVVNAMVKVGKSLLLPRATYWKAKHMESPASMTRFLIKNTFSRKRLIASSYSGQKRTRDGIVTQKKSLKKYQKMQDISDLVMQRFPYFSQSQLSLAANTVTGKKAESEVLKPELVETSGSESEADEDNGHN